MSSGTSLNSLVIVKVKPLQACEFAQKFRYFRQWIRGAGKSPKVYEQAYTLRHLANLVFKERKSLKVCKLAHELRYFANLVSIEIKLLKAYEFVYKLRYRTSLNWLLVREGKRLQACKLI